MAHPVASGRRLPEGRWSRRLHPLGGAAAQPPARRGHQATLPLIRTAELYPTRPWILASRRDLADGVPGLNVVRDRAEIGDCTSPEKIPARRNDAKRLEVNLLLNAGPRAAGRLRPEDERVLQTLPRG